MQATSRRTGGGSYRAEGQPGTAVTPRANLYGVALGNGVYGRSDQFETFHVHDAWVAKADGNTDTTQIFDSGQRVRSMPFSLGRGATPTHLAAVAGGQHRLVGTHPIRHPVPLAVLLVLAAAVLSGCGGAATPPVDTSLLPRPPVAAAVQPEKVLVVVEENHSETSALREMPYLAALAGSYGRTTGYRAVAHPSLPNYLALAGGSTFGVRDDAAPSSHPVSGESVFDRALSAHASAKTYAEAMPAPCALTDTGRYAVKHNPWAYFSDPTSRSNCQRFDVPAGTPSSGALHDDVVAGALPANGLLIPDLCHDGHDCSLSVADAWLQQWLPVVMQGPDYRSGHLAIVVTFDEDDNSGPNTVLTTVVAPNVAHVSSAVPFTHYSLSRYFAELTATMPLRDAAGAPSMRSAFGI